MITECLDEMEAYRLKDHPQCVVCSRSNEAGLGLDFRVARDGAVEAAFDCPRVCEGYPNVLHGGGHLLVVGRSDGQLPVREWATVGDCRNDCEVSVSHPHGHRVTVRARIEASMRPLHLLIGEVVQNGRVMAKAKGKFVEKQERTESNGEITQAVE